MSDNLINHFIDLERGAQLMASLGCAVSFLLHSDHVIHCRRDSMLRGLAAALLGWVFVCGIVEMLTWYPALLCRQPMSRMLVQMDTLCFPIGCLMLTSLTRRKQITPEACVRHILPFIGLILLSMLWLDPFFAYLSATLILIYLAAMTYLIMVSSAQYNRYIRDQYSDLYGISTRWIGRVVLCMIAITVMWSVCIYVREAWTEAIYTGLKCLLWCYLTVNLHRVLAVRETARYNLDALDMQMEDDFEYRVEKTPTEKVDLSAIASAVAVATAMTAPAAEHEEKPEDAAPVATYDPQAEFELRLQRICEEPRLYTTEDLTREELARAMRMNHTYFTRMLKQIKGKSFYEYINGLRMEYAGELLSDPQFPLDAIPLEVGYKHRSTYYRVFSDTYGCTPLEFRKLLCS